MNCGKFGTEMECSYASLYGAGCCRGADDHRNIRELTSAMIAR